MKAQAKGDRDEYRKLASRRTELRKRVNDAQDAFIEFMNDMTGRLDGIDSRLTARQTEAYRLVEQGKTDQAIALFNVGQLDAELADAERSLRMHRAQERNAKAGQANDIGNLHRNLNERLQKARLLETQTPTPELIEKLRETLQAAANLERNHNLGTQARNRYASFLLNHHDHEQATRLYEETTAIRRAQAENRPDDPDAQNQYATSLNNLVVAYRSKHQFDDAAQIVKESLLIQLRLVDKDFTAHAIGLLKTMSLAERIYRHAGHQHDADLLLAKAELIHNRISAMISNDSAALLPHADSPSPLITCSTPTARHSAQ